MGTELRYYNLNGVRDLVNEKFGYKFHKMSIVNYKDKNYLVSSGYYSHGKKIIPLYSEKDVDRFIKRLPKLIKEGKIMLHAKKKKNRTTENI